MKMSKTVKTILSGLAITSALIFGACDSNTIKDIANSVSSSNETSQSGDKVVVHNVIPVDGDTIKVDYDGEKKVPVRFLLIDTPETKHPKLGVQPFGKDASNFTKNAIAKANKVELEFESDGKRDKYGRLLAYVYVDGESLQEKLLAKGLARVAYIYKSNYIHLDEYQKVEEKAKDKKLNIWSKDGYVTKSGFGQGKSLAQVHNEEQAKETAKVNSGKCPVKANTNTHKYHVAGGAYYNTTTKNFVCYKTEQQAQKDGYVKSKR